MVIFPLSIALEFSRIPLCMDFGLFALVHYAYRLGYFLKEFSEITCVWNLLPTLGSAWINVTWFCSVLEFWKSWVYNLHDMSGTSLNLLTADRSKSRRPSCTGDCSHVQNWPCQVRSYCTQLDPKVCHGLIGVDFVYWMDGIYEKCVVDFFLCLPVIWSDIWLFLVLGGKGRWCINLL